jgi:hypothetical protein
MTRFESAANAVAISPSEELVAAGEYTVLPLPFIRFVLIVFFSSEGTVRLITRIEPTQFRSIKAHQGQVKSLAFDPKYDLCSITSLQPPTLFPETQTLFPSFLFFCKSMNPSLLGFKARTIGLFRIGWKC